MKVISWNVRGAVGKEFDRTFRLLMASQKSNIVIIQEPRCSGNRAISTIRKLGFRFHIISDARGYAGGIWILWNDGDLKLNVIRNHVQFIHVEVCPNMEHPWVLTAIYGSPREAERREL